MIQLSFQWFSLLWGWPLSFSNSGRAALLAVFKSLLSVTFPFVFWLRYFIFWHNPLVFISYHEIKSRSTETNKSIVWTAKPRLDSKYHYLAWIPSNEPVSLALAASLRILILCISWVCFLKTWAIPMMTYNECVTLYINHLPTLWSFYTAITFSPLKHIQIFYTYLIQPTQSQKSYYDLSSFSFFLTL